ncbi:MAG: GNAT family N-acetyltransferase [Chloroflexota bacterium]
MTYRVEALNDAHVLDRLACGNAALDDWLKLHARTATGQGTRTYVLVDSATGAVVGYFAIAPHLLERGATPAQIGRGAPRQIPAILLAKLALDQRAQGTGIGSELLVRALEKIVDAARQAGGKLVVVDAIDHAAAKFYQHYGFETLPRNPHRLVMKMSTVAKELGVPWP